MMERLFSLLISPTKTKSFIKKINVADELEKLMQLECTEQTVLHMICDKNYLEDVGEEVRLKMINLLHSLRTVDVNAQNKNLDTPMHLAVKSHYGDIVSYLVDKGGDKLSLNLQNQTPLYLAISFRCPVALVRKLVDPALVTSWTSDNPEESLFCIACKNYESLLGENNESEECDKLEVIQLLLSHDHSCINVHLTNWQNTALHLLCSNKSASVKAIKLFLQYDANPNARNTDGCTPLHMAAQNHDLCIIGLLLNYKADIHCVTNDGRNTLHFAALNKNVLILQFFIKCGLDMNKTSYGWFTPLFQAIWNDHIFIAKELLDSGANVNERVINNQTVLHVAVELQSPRIVEILLNYGADVNIIDTYGNTPLSILYKKRCYGFANQNLFNNFSQISVECTFIKHLAQKLVANCYINDINKKLILSPEFSCLYTACLSEIQIMKNEKLCDNLTFYQVLVKPAYKLVPWIRKQNLYVRFISSGHSIKYPIYKDVLSLKIHEAKKRSVFVENASRNLVTIIQGINEQWSDINVPDLILQEVLSYLSNRDVELLSKIF